MFLRAVPRISLIDADFPSPSRSDIRVLLRHPREGLRAFGCGSAVPGRFVAGKIRGLSWRLTSLPFPGTNRAVSVPLPPCPHLPAPRAGLDWRALHIHREDERGAAFYHDCLEYAHSLWQRGLAARAILCLDRAFGADLRGNEPVLHGWPLPYGAMVWLLRHTPATVFLGNPRVHFQHYADRMNAPRREQRAWRAWACWALTRALRPEFPADPTHPVVEPTLDAIAAGLRAHGHPGEAELWQSILTATS